MTSAPVEAWGRADLVRRFGPVDGPAVAGVFRVKPRDSHGKVRRPAYYLFRRTGDGAEDGLAWAAYAVVRFGSAMTRPAYAVRSGPAAVCSCECLAHLTRGTCRHVLALNALRAAGLI